MASAAHGSANNPCTNRPINCNECENTVIWSYSLNLHYLQKHQGLICPIIIDDKEKEKVLKK